MATFVQDTFTDTAGTLLTAHTGETGATWTKATGATDTLLITSDGRARSGGTSVSTFASGTPASADYSVQAVMTLVGPTVNGFNFLIARGSLSSATTNYRAGYQSGAWRIYKNTAAVGTTTTEAWTQGTSKTVRLSVSGSTTTTVQSYANDVLKAELVDSSSPLTSAGLAGIRFTGNDSDSTGIHLDNFLAYDGTESLTLSAGTASLVSADETAASVTCTAASGGTAPYTYQWHRSTSNGFTPGAGTVVSGATSLTLNDTGLSSGTTYYYVLVVTDSDATTANSNQVTATTTTPGAPLASGTASLSSVSTTTASVTSTAASGGTAPYTYQWYRSTSNGFTPGAGTVVSGATSLTLNDTGLSSGTTYYYVLIATDAASASVTSNQVTATTTAALTAGAITRGTTSASAVNLTAAAPTGGTAPYTYQWRATNNRAASLQWSAITGATSLSLTHDPGTNEIWWYYCRQTDAAGTNVNTAIVAGFKATGPYRVGIIGSSSMIVTYDGQNVGTWLKHWLEQASDPAEVVVVNRGSGGSTSGTWAPGSSLLTSAKTAFASNSVTHVGLAIGVNANPDGSTAAEWKEEVQAICDDLVTAGYTVVLLPFQQPDPMGWSGGTGTERLETYLNEYDSIADDVHIFNPDPWGLFKRTALDPDGLIDDDNLHLSADGVEVAGRLYANAFMQVFYAQAVGTSSSSYAF